MGAQVLLSPPGHKNQKWDFGDSLVSDLHPWAVLVEELGVQQAQVVLEAFDGSGEQVSPMAQAAKLLEFLERSGYLSAPPPAAAAN